MQPTSSRHTAHFTGAFATIHTDHTMVWAREILLALLAIFIAIIIIKYWRLRRRFRKQFSVIPGPRPLPIFGKILLFMKGPEEAFKTYLELHSNYGDTVLVWIGEKPYVSISKPQDVQFILSTQHSNNREFHTVRFLAAFLGQGLLTSKGEHWKRQRKIINPTFRYNILKYYFNNLKYPSQNLVIKLRKYADESIFNVSNFINLCIVDSIFETLLGVQALAQNNDIHHPFVKSIEIFLHVVYMRFVKPWLFIDWLFNMTQLKRDQQKAIKYARELADELVAEKMNRHKKCNSETDGNSRMTFIDFVLSSAGKIGVTLTPSELRDEVLTLLTAGIETTTTTTCYVLMMLALHPDCQEQVFQELLQVFEENADRPVGWEDLDKLQYLERVIKETMRLYPAAPILPRDVDKEVKLSHFTLPAGCSAVVFTYVLHRNPLYYPDPEKFDPERFLPENVKMRHPYSYIPFGGGLRRCVGYKYAMMQMKILLATVLRKYRLLPVLTREELNRIKISVTIKPVADFNIKMLPR